MSKGEIDKLKGELGQNLISSDRLKRPEGIPSGNPQLNQFLLWNGFPKGALSILTGSIGTGATSLWLESAVQVTKQKRWAVWIDREVQLFPLTLWQKELDLSRLVTIERPETEKKLLWLLQELMASTLFDLVGCDLGQMKFRDSQLRKLDKQARAFKTAVVFFAGRERLWNPSLFSLVVDCRANELCVERALHRPTPHMIPRRITYENFTLHCQQSRGQLNGGNRLELGLNTDLTKNRAPISLQGLEPRALLNPAKIKKHRGR
jgi:hypothetical protein